MKGLVGCEGTCEGCHCSRHNGGWNRHREFCQGGGSDAVYDFDDGIGKC